MFSCCKNSKITKAENIPILDPFKVVRSRNMVLLFLCTKDSTEDPYCFNQICSNTTSGISGCAVRRSQTSSFSRITPWLGKGTAERHWNQSGLCRTVGTHELFSCRRTPLWLSLPVSGQDHSGSAGVKLPQDCPAPVLKDACGRLAWCFWWQPPAQTALRSMIYLAAVGNYFTAFWCLFLHEAGIQRSLQFGTKLGIKKQIISILKVTLFTAFYIFLCSAVLCVLFTLTFSLSTFLFTSPWLGH